MDQGLAPLIPRIDIVSEHSYYLSMALRNAAKKKATEMSHESEWEATSESQSARFILFLGRLMPSAGSGRSGGIISSGGDTSHLPLAWPYRHRDSL